MFREAGFVILNIGAYEMCAGAACPLAGGGTAAQSTWPARGWLRLVGWRGIGRVVGL